MKRTPSTREVIAAAIIMLVLGVAGALQAGRAGASFMRDLEIETPALAKSPPVLPDEPMPRLARRVYLVIVDGLGYNRSFELPFLDDLRRRGIDLEAQSHYPSWSRPNYVSILTGVPPKASGVRTNFHYSPVMLDSLMDRTKAAGLRVAVATDSAALPKMFLRPTMPTTAIADPDTLEAIDDPKSPEAVSAPDAPLRTSFDDARYTPWPGGIVEAGAALVAGDADLVIVLFEVVDAAGHAHGARSPEYRDAALVADRTLQQILGSVDLEQDAVVITADHGHTDPGGHGGIEPEVLSVPLVLAGAGTKPGTVVYDARLIDVAPTVAALLGLPAPGHGLGRTLIELLAADRDALVHRQIADTMRTTTTQAVFAAAEARATTELLEYRALRLAFVAGGAVLATFLAFGLMRRRVLKLDAKVLLVAIPAFFVVYFALIGIVGQRFSPSLVPGQGHIAGALIKYAVVGVAVQLLASLWVLRNLTVAQRLAAANGIAWTGFMLTMVPAGILWAFFQAPYNSVPAPFWLVMIPALQVAVACAAANIGLTLLVEVIVFASRTGYRRAGLE